MITMQLFIISIEISLNDEIRIHNLPTTYSEGAQKLLSLCSVAIRFATLILFDNKFLLLQLNFSRTTRKNNVTFNKSKFILKAQ